MEPRGLTVHDPAYGTFCLPSYVRAAVGTVEFTRLKRLKQLGISDAIFDGADHTRHAHSLGACYLAGRLLDVLSKTLERPIREDERKCIMLAAVLHDVGHGPFSHMWEKFVEAYGVHWKHEKASVQMAHSILSSMDDITEKQINLICALIKGNASELLPAERQFLAHIVSSDVDVDRCDYLQRDAHYVPGIIEPSRPFHAMFDRVRVVNVRGEGLLAYHWEDYSLVYEMACARQTFHRRCYQHPDVLGVELMMLDVLHEAERAGFRFTRDGKSEPLSNVHTNPDLFKYLDDDIVEELDRSTHRGLQKAKEIIDRIRNKQMYKEIIRFPVNMEAVVKDYNDHQGEPVVAQASRFIKSTKQWFRSFNINFYKPEADGSFTTLSVQEAKDLNTRALCGSSDEIEEYIIYCTSTDPIVEENAKYHFVNLLFTTTHGS